MKPNKMKTTTVVLNGKKLVVGAIALVAAVGAFAGAGPQDYVQDGLVALYDAEFNSTNAQGEPMHDDSATVWMNLVKTGSDLPLPASGVTIGEKVMTFDCVTATATDCSVANLAMPVTLEACARSTASATTHKSDLLFVVQEKSL